MASENTNRIAKNTLYMYLRQLVSLIITFATVGITLDALGEVDYGINNLVAGTVTMFVFLSGAMAVGNQRFFAYYLGKKDIVKLRRIVSGTLFIYVCLAIVFLILGETVGLWFLNCKLVIPANRMYAANWVFQLGLISLCVSTMGPPFYALITAHENMGFYAKLTVWTSVARLLTLYLLVVLPFDKLILLNVISLIIGVINLSIAITYCRRKYIESHTWPKYEKPIFKELIGFNFWNLCGNLAWMIKNQGTGFILNIFFGPVLNAAQGIATGVRGMSTTFADGFKVAMSPQITKSYAAGELPHMFKLSFSGVKIVFLLMAIVVLPAIFNIEFVLSLWLKETPPYTVIFCQIMLVEILLENSSSFLATIQQATGKIRTYQMLIGFYGCLNLPLSYVALRLGAAAEWVFVISLIMQLFVIGVRVGYLKRVDAASRGICIRHVIIPCLLSGCVAALLCALIPRSNLFAVKCLIILLQIGITAASVYFIAFGREERMLCLSYVKKFFGKFSVKRKKQ